MRCHHRGRSVGEDRELIGARQAGHAKGPVAGDRRGERPRRRKLLDGWRSTHAKADRGRSARASLSDDAARDRSTRAQYERKTVQIVVLNFEELVRELTTVVLGFE